MLAFLHLHTSPENLITATLTWKSVVLDICDMPYTTQPNMSATGIPFAEYLAKKRAKESITMLPYPMPSKSCAANLCLAEIWQSISCSCLILSRA